MDDFELFDDDDIFDKVDELMASSPEFPDYKDDAEEGSFDEVTERLNAVADDLESIRANVDSLEERAVACDEYLEELVDELSTGNHFFEESMITLAYTTITKELLSIQTKAATEIAAAGIAKAINTSFAKFLLKKFELYPQIYSEVDPIKDFKKANFDVLEAESRFKTNFRFANKWAEKLDNRVEVKVFFIKDKAAFAVAYGKLSSDKMYNTEFVMIDKKYNSHVDYYTACAHAVVGIGHPSIPRLLKKIKDELIDLKKKAGKVIEESAEDAIIDGRFDEMCENIRAAASEGLFYMEDAESMINAMERSTIDMSSYDMW